MTFPAGSQLYINVHHKSYIVQIHAVIVVGGDNAEGHTYMPLTPSGAAVCVTVWLCNTVERYSCLACVCDVGTKVLCADKSFINSNVRP